MPSSYTLPRERAVTRAAREPYVAAQLIGVMFMGSTLLTPLYILYRRAFGFSEMTLTLIYAVYVVGNIGALFFSVAFRTRSVADARACPRWRRAALPR